MTLQSMFALDTRLFARKGEAAPASSRAFTVRSDASSCIDERKPRSQQQPARRCGSSLAFLIQREQEPAQSSVRPDDDVYADCEPVQPALSVAPVHAAPAAVPVAMETADPSVAEPAVEIAADPRRKRRKMTVRLKEEDYHRCRRLAESCDMTFQKILETGVARYLDTVCPRTRN